MSLIVRKIAAASAGMKNRDLVAEVRCWIVDDDRRAERFTAHPNTDPYRCPSCSFTAGVRIPGVNRPGELTTVRCLSCGQLSEYPAPAGPPSQTQ